MLVAATLRLGQYLRMGAGLRRHDTEFLALWRSFRRGDTEFVALSCPFCRVIPAGGAIPPAPEPLPDSMEYDPATRRLSIGKGHIDNVMPEVWAYEVSGKNVLRQWFSYRRRDRSKPIIGDRRPPSPLDAIQPDGWLNEYTVDLMNLLHVLGRLVLLEPKQADLMTRILAEPLIKVDALFGKADNPAESERSA